jgi:glutamate--cysteine ligase
MAPAMSTRTATAEDEPPVTHRDELIAVFAAGEKPRAEWRIGTEHEKFVFRRADHRAPAYDEPGGIHDLLLGMTRFGWQPVEENGKVIALSGDDGTVSLEPAGQLELSGAPLADLHATAAEAARHVEQVKAVGEGLGLGYLALGLWPDKTRAELPIMPKGRYDIMLRHMPRVGTLGLDMMLRTCTIQTNLDYASEADMARKFRVSLALQPLATALFANSPFLEGRPNGYLSYRSHIWTDTDPARTGMLPFVFDDSFGYERYADYALDVPMYFVFRDGRYIDAAGQSFRDFLQGRLPALPGELPRLSDWTDHLSTAFPEVRLKSFLEMRGADGGPLSHIAALPAFWVGLLYDGNALDAAYAEIRNWTIADQQRLRDEVPMLALNAACPGGGTLRELAGRVLEISRGGLRARNRRDDAGNDETIHLAPLETIAASGKTSAELLLDHYHGDWGGDLSRVYEAMKF